MVLSFFMVGLALFPFGIGPEPQMLARIAPGIIIVMVLLACLISLDRMFQADYEDGALDQWMMADMPLSGVVLAKIFGHWLSTMVPLVVFAPILGLMVNLPDYSLMVMWLALLVATPAFSSIGAIGAALTVAVRRGGVLVSLLVLPLYIPSLIFAVGAVDAVILSGSASLASGMVGDADSLEKSLPHLALAGAVSLLAFVAAVPSCVAALKIAQE